jgi:glycosyltransferase involved in cell wall biosynthesis
MTRPLRIGVDARELIGDTTGAGRYLGELMRRWTMRRDSGRRRFILYTPSPLTQAFPPGTAEQRVAGKGTGTWWEQTTLRRAVNVDRPEIFFAPAYTAPIGVRAPLAVTIHDISFVAHPEWFRPRERWRRRFITARTAAAAAVVLTDSDFSRRELETRLGIGRERIRVIPPGVATLGIRDSGLGTRKPGFGIRDPGLESGDSGFGIRDSGLESRDSGFEIRDPKLEIREPLVLFVGSIFNRRRLPDLITAFARAAHDMPRARLVIAGADRTWPAQDLAAVAAAQGLGAKVELRHYVSETELAALYSRASVFAFLSEYEGFGFTPLEALAANVPIVVLDTPVAREVYGPAARYVQGADLEGIATALRSILLSPSSAAEEMAHAHAVLARYSWDRAADDTLTALESIAV